MANKKKDGMAGVASGAEIEIVPPEPWIEASRTRPSVVTNGVQAVPLVGARSFVDLVNARAAEVTAEAEQRGSFRAVLVQKAREAGFGDGEKIAIESEEKPS